jgi:hypothetical protein
MAGGVAAGPVGLGAMRTPLAWTLRVTISPWNSWPDFLKVPMFAMSLLLGCSSPRPSRPRWRSAGRRRSAPHPSSGRSAAEDGGGESFLARARMGEAQEKKVSPPPLRPGDRGAAGLWPDQAIRGHVARAGLTAPGRRRGGYSAPEAGLIGRRKRNLDGQCTSGSGGNRPLRTELFRHAPTVAVMGRHGGRRATPRDAISAGRVPTRLPYLSDPTVCHDKCARAVFPATFLRPSLSCGSVDRMVSCALRSHALGP